MTDCRNCKTEIKKTMMGWVHVVSGLFRCHKVPTPDPQLYAEPVYEIDRPRCRQGFQFKKFGYAPYSGPAPSPRSAAKAALRNLGM